MADFLKFDLTEFQLLAKHMNIAEKQVPYAASKTINNAAFKAREYLINDTWPRSVVVRNKGFLRQALHDLQAEKLAVDNGFKSRSDVIVASGSDPVETDKRIAADAERSKNLGIKFDDKNSGLPGGQTNLSAQPENGNPPGTDEEDDQQNGYNSP